MTTTTITAPASASYVREYVRTTVGYTAIQYYDAPEILAEIRELVDFDFYEPRSTGDLQHPPQLRVGSGTDSHWVDLRAGDVIVREGAGEIGQFPYWNRYAPTRFRALFTPVTSTGASTGTSTDSPASE